MRHDIHHLAACFLLAVATRVHAGPQEEVAEIDAPRLELMERGDAGSYATAFAENGVLHSELLPFRVEGRSAIRAQFAQFFLIYPKRKMFIRQPTVRVYGEELLVQNAYADLYLTDTSGKVLVVPSRSSTVWSRANGKWQIVEQHVSRLQGAQ